jgi:hypothetical protein
MGLMETLDQCITAGHEMTKAIAIAQFNDDSPEARKITRRWRVGEAADLIGVSSQAIRDAEKAGRLPHPDMEMRGRVEQRWATPLNKSTICGMYLAPVCAVLMTAFRPSSRWQHIKGCL